MGGGDRQQLPHISNIVLISHHISAIVKAQGGAAVKKHSQHRHHATGVLGRAASAACRGRACRRGLYAHWAAIFSLARLFSVSASSASSRLVMARPHEHDAFAAELPPLPLLIGHASVTEYSLRYAQYSHGAIRGVVIMASYFGVRCTGYTSARCYSASLRRRPASARRCDRATASIRR